MARKAISREKFKNLEVSRINSMTNKELRSVLRGARQLLTQTEEVLHRNEDKYFSYAYDKLEKYYQKNPQQSNISRMKQNDLRKEVNRLHEFFNSETSTIKGIETVQREADRRIFGVDAKGRAKHRMTAEESKEFWAMYDEFKNMEKEAYFRNMGSNNIQQVLGEMAVEAAKAKDDELLFDASTFRELKRRVEEKNATENWERVKYEKRLNNIFTPTRNGRKK